ncbi:hypothetical protein GMLC_33260 [Geomonas limicola]|uniref:Uncharacterized protein n=1 Tax=Geomonas limicola TaxID=2740186 RepID=A0A6V8ND74_9BACT|nr:hypothetical protein GMLC_33260 [Geomonas limicola]
MQVALETGRLGYIERGVGDVNLNHEFGHYLPLGLVIVTAVSLSKAVDAERSKVLVLQGKQKTQ